MTPAPPDRHIAPGKRKLMDRMVRKWRFECVAALEYGVGAAAGYARHLCKLLHKLCARAIFRVPARMGNKSRKMIGIRWRWWTRKCLYIAVAVSRGELNDSCVECDNIIYLVASISHSLECECAWLCHRTHHISARISIGVSFSVLLTLPCGILASHHIRRK